MIFPLTYVLLAFWVVFFRVFDPTNFGARMITGFFGLALAFDTLLGEKWLAIDPTTNALSVTTFDTGFSYIVGTILLGYSMIMLYYTVIQRRKK